MLIDLQLHSTYSDGYLTPTEVVDFIHSKGIKVAALTDHNTVGGLDEFRAACIAKGIKPITGLELYVKHKNKRLNFLWYNFDDRNPQLHKLLRDTQVRRRKKVREALNKLVVKGFEIDVDNILDEFNHYIPVNQVVDRFLAVPENAARVMAEMQTNILRENEVINKYFYNKETSFLDNTYVSLERILKLKKDLGGKIIFNHPGKYNQLRKPVLEDLKHMGIDGIEVLSPHHSYGAVVYAQLMAREFDLIETGGSDFHRHEGNNFRIQNSWNYFKIDSSKLRKINEIIE
ncbi:PHP domain-containing protein [Candidatus Parcubacteria bacterium]|nr:PHP domain-containing protein [Patescibacteria group bacterium]MBU4309857.1 PHP domain-containing protein [Patescibacteria group bacterium]MBU4431732.1 PHP domain-containing protein [Patescibacteria group bacterium]MBU4578196.1 PHP domain-containing protein [Patescibacteria group bacterium]MCG2696732.1 PHP domain-containing protein [Candidatus Parcubacteria bacterium]